MADKAQHKSEERQSASSPVPASPARIPSRAGENPMVNLQRRAGNQAVLGLLRSQAKRAHSSERLTINAPGDSYEHEADRAAEHVMSEPLPQLEGGCNCGGTCSKCQAKPGVAAPIRLQAKAGSAGSAGSSADGTAPGTVHEVLRSPGQPLDAASRAFMEPRLGHDFSDVKVHADEAAAESAKAVKAKAYTVGKDVVFGAGRYSPATGEGKRLLAHELAHTVQQRQAGDQATPGIVQREVDDERASDTAIGSESGARGAASAGAGQPAGIVKIVVYSRETGGAWAYFSSGDMRLVTVRKNQLKPGKYKITRMGGPESGPSDATIIEHESGGFVWDHPVEYSVSGPIELEVKLTPQQRIAQLPPHIRAYVTSGMGKHPSFAELEGAANQGEELVKSGVTADDLKMASDPSAAIEMQGKAPPDPDLVESMRRRGFSNFPSREEYMKSLAWQMLNTPGFGVWWAGDSPAATAATAAAYWRDFPEEAKKDWAEYSQRRYESDKAEEAAEWREAFRRIDAAAGAVNAIAIVTVAVAGGFVGGEVAALWPELDLAGGIEAVTGAKAALWGKALAYSWLATSFLNNLINRHREGSAAGSNPVSEASAAVLDTFGVGKVVQAARNESILTGEKLHLGTTERWVGAITGLGDIAMTGLGVRDWARSTPPRFEGTLPGKAPIEEAPLGETPSETPAAAGEPVAAEQVAPPAPPGPEGATTPIKQSDQLQTIQEWKPGEAKPPMAEPPVPKVPATAKPGPISPKGGSFPGKAAAKIAQALKTSGVDPGISAGGSSGVGRPVPAVVAPAPRELPAPTPDPVGMGTVPAEPQAVTPPEAAPLKPPRPATDISSPAAQPKAPASTQRMRPTISGQPRGTVSKTMGTMKTTKQTPVPVTVSPRSSDAFSAEAAASVTPTTPAPTSQKRVRGNTRPFVDDQVKKLSNPSHVLHQALVVPVLDARGNQMVDKDNNPVFALRTTTFTAKSGRVMTGRYQGSEHGVVVQIGHAEAFASGAPERYMLEDADLNQMGGQTIESRGSFSEKIPVDVDGVIVDRATLQQLERLGAVPAGTVAKAKPVK